MEIFLKHGLFLTILNTVVAFGGWRTSRMIKPSKYDERSAWMVHNLQNKLDRLVDETNGGVDPDTRQIYKDRGSLDRVWLKRTLDSVEEPRYFSTDRIWMKKRQKQVSKRSDAWWQVNVGDTNDIGSLWMKRNIDRSEDVKVKSVDPPDSKVLSEIELPDIDEVEEVNHIISKVSRKVDEDNEPGVDDSDEKSEKSLRYEVDLDTAKTMKLSWDIDTVTETVYFQLEAKMTRSDLLGFGFSSYGESTNADLVAMWTNHDGMHMFQDTHTDEDGILYVDDSQDYHLDGVDLQPGKIKVQFHRIYDTCDDSDYIIDSGTTHMIFFTIPGLVEGVDGLNVTAIAPPLQRVQLIKSQLPDPELPEDTFTFSMTVEDVPVPPDETTYWCSVRKLPPFEHKMHIVKYEGAITPASEGIVHHLEVFHCQVAENEELRDYNGPCKSKSERPMGLEACRNVLGAWAMGAKGVTFPEEAGYPIGGRGFSRYVMLEVHYNNPTHRKGVIDSSGIQFHVTSQLRQYDAGIIELGLEYTDKYAIPPQQPLFKLEGYCIPDCTKVALPEDGINIFASQLHTHLTGKQVYVKHYRDGIELPEVNRDNHYSPHYQEIRKLPRPVRVLPGDSLVTTCIDSTKDNDNLVMGGFAISDEMCVSYNMYYPKVDLEVCKSSVTTRSLYGFFNFLNEYQHEATSPQKGINDNFHSIDWKPMNAQLLKTFFEVAPLSMQCNKSSGDKFPGNWEGKRVPQILFPLPPEERPCLT